MLYTSSLYTGYIEMNFLAWLTINGFFRERRKVMRKVKRVLATIICFSALLSTQPVYAAESRVIQPCKHTVVYITTVDITPESVDDVYHCLRTQEVDKCAQCGIIVSRGLIHRGDLKHHHFKNVGTEWKCEECGATKSF